jgi:hypothetical protein
LQDFSKKKLFKKSLIKIDYMDYYLRPPHRPSAPHKPSTPDLDQISEKLFDASKWEHDSLKWLSEYKMADSYTKLQLLKVIDNQTDNVLTNGGYI